MEIATLRGGFVFVSAVAFLFFVGFLLMDSRPRQVGDTSVFNAIHSVNNDTPPYDYYALRAADDALKKCELKEFPDGWTDEAVNIFRNCNRNYTPLTELVDARVRLLKKDNDSGVELLACRARSILWKRDLDYSAGDWVNISENRTLPHDAVHVQCAKEPTNFTDSQIIYNFVHQQIYRNRSVDSEKERAAVAEREKKRAIRPSVHVILLDSIGNTAMLHFFPLLLENLFLHFHSSSSTMPRTVGFLKGELGAVDFRHVNKVGYNSPPNGAAILLGIQLAHFDRSLLGLPSVPTEYDSGFCNHLDLDKQKMVIKEFEKLSGLHRIPDDDLVRERVKAVAETMNAKNCMPGWLAQLEYLDKFVKEYSDTPKASLSWLTYLAHENNDDAFGADDLIHDLLEKNRKEFEDSFVFFTSDHGMRWGEISSSEIGAVERNSAALLLSMPRWLRKNKALMKNMRKHSGKLLTQFDVHATFIDLIETLPSSNFSDFAMLPPNKTGLRGSSLFRPLPEGPRNCFTLPIPFEYCMCNLEFVDVKEEFVKTAVEKAIVSRINQLIGARNFTALCHNITEAKATSVKTVKRSKGLFRVRVNTNPGGGEFETWLRDIGPRGSPFFIAVSPSLSRLNKYGNAADCLASTGTEDMRPLCFCKQTQKGR